MSKQISLVMTYPGFDVETVYAMYADADYVQQMNEQTGGENVRVEVTAVGNGHRIVMARDLPAEIPSYAKKFVGEKISTVETDTWGGPAADGSRSADLVVDFGKAPIAVKGSMTLSATVDGAVCSITAEIKCGVPFVGGKVEGFAADQLTRAARAQERIGNDWLAK